MTVRLLGVGLVALLGGLLSGVGSYAHFELRALNPQAGPRIAAKRLILLDKRFRCGDFAQPLDIDLLKVTLTENYTGRVHSAVMFTHGECTGRIGRLEVETWIGDAVKVGGRAHDLTIESGWIKTWRARHPAIHEGGVQVMGGTRVTFRNIQIFAPTGRPGYINSPEEAPARDVVFENCLLRAGGALHVFRVKRSIRSGIRNCVIVADHPKTERAVNIQTPRLATEPINENNRILTPRQAADLLPDWMGPAVRLSPLHPTAAVKPRVVGALRPGGLLRFVRGRWTGGPSVFAYRWQRCRSLRSRCIAIPGATEASYRIRGADRGMRLRLVIWASNGRGAGRAATNRTAVVTP